MASMPIFRTRAENASGPSETNSLPMSSSAKLLDTKGTPVQSSSNGFVGSAFRRFTHLVRNCRPAGLAARGRSPRCSNGGLEGLTAR